jgi:hypothetical protein
MFIVDKCVSSILISNKSLRFYSGNKDVKTVSNNWSKSLSFVLYSVTHAVSVLETPVLMLPLSVRQG